MKNSREGGISVYWLLCITVLLTIYVIPSAAIPSLEIPIGKFFFLGVALFLYVYLILVDHKVKYSELSIIIISLLFVFLRKDISYLHLISIALAIRLGANNDEIDNIKEKLLNSNILYICLAFTIFYSAINFGRNGRYIFTGITYDPNMAGMAIFCLFIMIYQKNKKIGKILLIAGIFSFSRGYLLALCVFAIYSFAERKGYSKKYNYALLGFISILVLLLIANIYIAREKAGGLSLYQSGLSHYLTIFDYSNYFRFTTNANLLGILKDNPVKILTGIDEEEFLSLNLIYARKHGLLYRAIRPHNYFFSYIRLYGIWCVPIFGLTWKAFKQVITEKNNGVALSIFLYLVFLGIGATNYWLFLSLFTLISIGGMQAEM